MVAQTASFSCGLRGPTAWHFKSERPHGDLQLLHPLPTTSLRHCRLRPDVRRSCQQPRLRHRSGVLVRAAVEQEPKIKEETTERAKGSEAVTQQNPEEVTKKYGLEAGLWQIFKSKDRETGKSRGQQAKDLLAKYGVAYIGTSVALSLVSITVCYLLINSGVDVAALLEKVGIHPNEQGEQVGTFALAYAAHKALSPVRFPPTVALTPIVANLFGKKPKEGAEEK